MLQVAKNTFPSKRPKLLDQIRAVIRTRHDNMRTEEACIHWIKGVGYLNYASIFSDSNSDCYFKIPLQNKLSHLLKKYIFAYQKRRSAKQIIELKVIYEEVHIQRLIRSAGGS